MSNPSEIKSELEKELAQYDTSKENPLRGMLFSSFARRMRWAAVLTWAYILLFTVIAIYVGTMFFMTPAVGEKLLWSTIFLGSVMTINVVKLWYWMIANRNALTREIKRLELRVALLAEKLDSGK